MSEATRDTTRFVYLDVLRAVAALVVVFGHCAITVVDPAHLPGWLWFLQYVNFAVAAFIVVSGFSLGLAHHRRPTLDNASYLRRRAWRILPPYLACVVVSTLLILTLIGDTTGSHWDVVLPLSWLGVLVHLVLLQDVFHLRAPNHVLWSIAVEWHLYFTVPLLVVIRRAFGRRALVAAAAVGTLVLLPFYGGVPYVGFPPQFAALFVFGWIAADVAMKPGALARVLHPTVVLTGAIASIGVAVEVQRHVDTTFVLAELVLGAALAALLAALALAPLHPVRRLCEPRLLAGIGVFSYSLYLTHAFTVQVLWQYAIHPLGLSTNAELAATIVGGAGVSLAVAYAFHLAFERPFLEHRSLRSLLGARDRVSAALPAA